MRNHPDIEYVVRGRDGLYAEGATKGAPQAKQVADRFHLLQNLRKTRLRLNWLESERRPALSANHRRSWPSLAGTAMHARVWPGGTCAS